MENRDSKSSWLREQWRQYEESQTSVAVIFAGIAALFVAGIAAAFIYAKDTAPMQTTSASAPAPAATTTTPAPPIASAPETTGSGGGNQYNPPKQDPRENEQIERPR
jgi:hypothetical protein